MDTTDDTGNVNKKQTMESNDDITEDSPAEDPVNNIRWSSTAFTPRQLLDEFALTHKLPIIVKTTHAHNGENPIETIGHGQVALLKGWEKQERVLARDSKHRLLSLPLEWSVKFKVNQSKWKRSKPKLLKEITSTHHLPVRVHFDKIAKWKFKIGRKQVTNLKHGALVVLGVYTEHFLLGMPINNGTIELDHEQMMTLPLYTNVHFLVARDTGTADDLNTLHNSYNNAVRDIQFSKMFGTEDVFFYKKEYEIFNKTLAKSLSSESRGRVQSGLRQDFADGARLLPSMSTSFVSNNPGASEQQDNNNSVKEAGSATVSVKQNGVASTTTETSTRTLIEDEAGHSTDSGVVDTTKQVLNNCTAQVTMEAPPPARTQTSVGPSESASVTRISLQDVHIHGSNEDLAHDEDAISALSAPWGYDGGRYRSLVTVSEAGSDIVSDVEDDADARLSPRRTKHYSLPRKQQQVYQRYGPVVGDMPVMRKPYVTRSVIDVRQVSPPRETQHFSLKRIHGSGPMRYYIPDVSPDRLHGSAQRHSYATSPVRHRGLQLGLDGGYRDTMSEVGVPPYRMPYRSNININIPEDSLDTVDYNSNYIDRSYHGDHYDVIENMYIDGSGLRRPHSQRRVKTRSHSARRHNDVQHSVVTVDPIDRQIPLHETAHLVQNPVEMRSRTRHRTARTATVNDQDRPLRLPHKHATTEVPQHMSSFIDVTTGEVIRKRSTVTTPPTDMSQSFQYQSESLDRHYGLRSMSLGRPRHMRPIPVIYSDSDDEFRRPISQKHSVSPGQDIAQYTQEAHANWSRAYEQPAARHDRESVRVVQIPTQTNVTKVPNNTQYQTHQNTTFHQSDVSSIKRNDYRDSMPSKIYYEDVLIGDLEPSKQSLTREKRTVVETKPVIAPATHSVHNTQIMVEDNNITTDRDNVDPLVFQSSYLGRINVDSQNSVQSVPVQSFVENASHTRSHESTASVTHTVPTVVNGEPSFHASQAPPTPPPPPPISPLSPSPVTNFTRDKSSRTQPAHEPVQPSKTSSDNVQGALQNELKAKLAKRTEPAKGEIKGDAPVIIENGRTSGGVVMRDKSLFAKAVERSSANSLRQVYALQRDSIEGLISVAKPEPEFEDVMNSSETKTDSHDTLKSSGYGSVSSKTEMRIHVSKSSTSKPYLDPMPSPTRGKHAHTNPDNPWTFEGTDNLRDGHTVRESIISIRELDEYLKQQSVGAESDSESVKHFEGTGLGLTDLELTHL